MPTHNSIIKQLWNTDSMLRLFDSSNIGFIIVSEDRRLLDANETFCKLLEYSRAELLTMNVMDLTKTQDHQLTNTLFDHVHEPNLISTFEKRYISKSGKDIWCKLRSEAIRDEQGKLLYRLLMVEDITKERHNELNVEQLAVITESSDDAIFRTDPNGIIEFWGKGAERLYGYTAAEVLGKSGMIIAPKEDNAVLVRILDKINKGQIAKEPDAIALHKSGKIIHISALVFPIKNQLQQIVAHAVIHQDISAYKELEQQLHHSQRLETAGLLASGIAHDFNNLITVIQGACELLYQRYPTESPELQFLGLIESSAERATRLTRQLLAFSRKQKVLAVIIDPNQLIEESVSILSRTLGDDITLTTNLESSWYISQDTTQLEQVLLNLAVNARHAMSGGGVLAITSSNFTLRDSLPETPQQLSRYTPGSIKAGEYVLLTISDSGSGMPAQTLEHIFDPFYSTKPKGEGTGLGLSVVYGMVTQVGGGISVLSKPGFGTTFQLLLPRASGEPVKQTNTVAARMNSGSGTILIVEDDEGVRTLTAALLESSGYTVTQASGPADVLENRVSGEVDLIVSDIMMPNISGPEFYEIWIKQHPDAKFLFMSGYFDDASFKTRLKGKILLQKPFKPSLLLDHVQRLLGKAGSAENPDKLI